MKLATIQFAPVFKDIEGNLKTAAGLVVEAAKAGAKLIVLPELCTTGYSFMSEEDAEPYTEMISSYLRADEPRSMHVFGTLARKLDVAIAWGVAEKDFANGGHLYNSQVLILPSQAFWVCRKLNPWGNDFLWAKEGTTNPPIAEWMGKKIGMLICADVRGKSDKIEDFYEAGDADIVCFSANWGDGGFPAGKWVKFAKENRCTFVVSNRYGREANNNFGEGGICIIDPSGKVHCDGLKWNEPCVVHFDAP